MTKNETVRPGTELDVLKFYIWLMVVMTLALAGFLWFQWSRLDATKANLAKGQTLKKDFEVAQAEIQSMLNVYKNNKEDEARESPNKWFSIVCQRVGINALNIRFGTWRVPARYDAKGKYDEEQYDMTIESKSPLSRETIAKLCHEIEKSSTRLRILELHVNRADKDGLEKDDWAGKIFIGYRHARVN